VSGSGVVLEVSYHLSLMTCAQVFNVLPGEPFLDCSLRMRAIKLPLGGSAHIPAVSEFLSGCALRPVGENAKSSKSVTCRKVGKQNVPEFSVAFRA
jgi:hypothetical protein